MAEQNNPKWTELLVKAVNEPGTISAAYNAFHDYSTGNQMLALWQCASRGIEPGPISTYPGWLKKHRFVRKGEKALTLCMPVTFKKKNASDEDKPEVITAFVYKPHWFVLGQTSGEDYEPEAIPEWDKAMALAALDIEESPFDHVDGNCQGYASGRTVAVSPIAFNPYKTLFHEMAHVLMHQGEHQDGKQTPRDIKEVEAESVALIVAESLGLGELSECRGYIQHWLRQGGKDAIPEKSAQKIFATADKILKAGRSKKEAIA